MSKSARRIFLKPAAAFAVAGALPGCGVFRNARESALLAPLPHRDDYLPVLRALFETLLPFKHPRFAKLTSAQVEARLLEYFPLGAYRLATGGVASLRVDVRLFGTLELGLRGSTLVYPDGLAYGGSVHLMLRAGGFDIHLGVGLGRPEEFHPNGFATVRALWMF
jgi:hypothetical protein